VPQLPLPLSPIPPADAERTPKGIGASRRRLQKAGMKMVRTGIALMGWLLAG